MKQTARKKVVKFKSIEIVDIKLNPKIKFKNTSVILMFVKSKPKIYYFKSKPQ